MRKFNLSDVLSSVEGAYQISGKADGKYFTNLKPILTAEKHSLVFISDDQKDKMGLIRQTQAEIIICDMAVLLTEDLLESKCLIHVKNPRLVFTKVGNALFKKLPSYGIHPTSVIHPDAKVHKNAYIGPFSYVGKCVIGKGTIIYGHTHLYDNTIIGENVIIHAGCVIGADGFGYVRNEEEELENFPHIGGVIIEEDVEIGANTCIDRGSLDNTIIKQGAKVDNLVHIAHNVIVGRHSLVIANAMIGGSTVIGDYAWVSPSSALRDQINIGEHAVVGLGAVVTKDVPDHETWVGSPARPLDKFILREKKLKEITDSL